MDRTQVAAILRELLAAEQRSLIPRLMESALFVGSDCIGDDAVIQQMIRAYTKNTEQLTRMLFDVASSPGPRAVDVRSATLHFQELHHVVPQLLRDRETLINMYREASSRLARNPEVLTLTNSIFDRHREELLAIQQLIPATAIKNGAK